jgi:CheY-like chemotaxis protein
MRLPQALQTAKEEDVDLAILDVNLDGRASYPVADILESRGVPVIFASGYGAVGLDPAYRDRVTLTKPFFINDLRGAIEQALEQGPAH